LVSLSIGPGSLLVAMIACEDSSPFHVKAILIRSTLRSGAVNQVEAVTSGCSSTTLTTRRAADLVVLSLTEFRSPLFCENDSFNTVLCMEQRSLVNWQERHCVEDVVHLFNRVGDETFGVSALVRLLYLLGLDSHPRLRVLHYLDTVFRSWLLVRRKG